MADCTQSNHEVRRRLRVSVGVLRSTQRALWAEEAPSQRAAACVGSPVVFRSVCVVWLSHVGCATAFIYLPLGPAAPPGIKGARVRMVRQVTTLAEFQSLIATKDQLVVVRSIVLRLDAHMRHDLIMLSSGGLHSDVVRPVQGYCAGVREACGRVRGVSMAHGSGRSSFMTVRARSTRRQAPGRTLLESCRG